MPKKSEYLLNILACKIGTSFDGSFGMLSHLDFGVKFGHLNNDDSNALHNMRVAR